MPARALPAGGRWALPAPARKNRTVLWEELGEHQGGASQTGHPRLAAGSRAPGKLAIVGVIGSRASVSPTATASALWPPALLVSPCEQELGLGGLWPSRCPHPLEGAQHWCAYHPHGCPPRGRRRAPLAPAPARSPPREREVMVIMSITSTMPTRSSPPRPPAMLGSCRQPGRASRHLPAPRAKHKPGHAGHRPPVQPTGFTHAAATGASPRRG